MKKAQAGFTIVELVVVIAVIGILAATTIAAYGTVQRDAKDTAIKTAAQQTADALKLWSTRNNLNPNQTGASNSGTGWVQTGAYSTQTIEEFMIAQGYLNQGFSTKLSSQNVTAQNRILMFYACSTGRYAVYAALNDASEEATQRAKASAAGCDLSSYDTYNMNYVILF